MKYSLEVKNLGSYGVFKNVSFQLHAGEVLGLAGVVGSGVEEICEVICGDEKPTSGEMYVRGQKVNFSCPSKAMKKGILMIPKERLYEGIVGIMSIEDNIALSNGDKIANGLYISAKKVEEQATNWIEKLRIKANGPKESLMQLSGGNQQKVVFARALASECDILILNHPTRGVDVGAKAEIYALIRDITEQGKAVILLGDTTDEYLGLSSRLIVMKDGIVTGEFDAIDEMPSQVEVVSYMM
ncbi:ATP-binding cassette domain-containing protein [Oscillospiraceae bacterium NTUH-002-81]|nr:ATP-binding cassette domain-containing protein [Oscillospiraceae bacterium NTUH-002-81]